MTQQVLDIVTAYQDAWTSGDLDTAAAYLAPDFRFESPGASFSSADEFLPFLARFAGRIGHGWRQVAAFGDGDEMLVMYELRGPAGGPLPLTVDHFVVRGGLLAAETLVFDTAAFGQAMAAGAVPVLTDVADAGPRRRGAVRPRRRCPSVGRGSANTDVGRMPNSRRSARLAANQPPSPCTPGPGGVAAEHRYTPSTPRRTGRARRWGGRSPGAGPAAPAEMSPPTRLALWCDIADAGTHRDATTTSRNPGANRSMCAGDGLGHVDVGPGRDVRVAPQRTQAVVPRPASTTEGSLTRQTGSSACRPACTSDSARAMSARVPPTCTVPARATSGCAQGTGPDRTKSTFAAASPCRYALERGAPAGGQLVAQHLDERPRRRVEQVAAGRGEVAARAHQVVGDDRPAVRAQVLDQRGDDRAGAATGDRPPVPGVREGGQQQGGPGSGRAGQRGDGVRGHAGQQRGRHVAAEAGAPGAACPARAHPARTAPHRRGHAGSSPAGRLRLSPSAARTTSGLCRERAPTSERHAGPSTPRPSTVRSRSCHARPARPPGSGWA